MTQASRYLCALIRVAMPLAASLGVASAALAQTVAGGLNHSVILKSDGTVWTVGANVSGQLGDNTTTTRKSPIQVSGLTGVVAVAAGENHSLAITSTGALYVWGENGNGQVGDASTTDRKTPVQSNLTNVVGIAAGSNFSVALKSNGDVYVWGGDNKGQLGDSTPGSTNTTSPALLTTGAAAIAAGDEFLLVVKTDGTVYGTGENSDYQLGDGTNTDRSSLVQMGNISTATAAAAGARYSIILLSGGTLKSIGYNGQGGLGDGTTTNRTSVVSVATVSNITAIASGVAHVVARESDGTVWAWGLNNSGQVGNDNAGTNATSPVELTSIASILSIGTGSNHALAATSGGVVYTWGDNSNYQLGDGTNVDRHVPTPICDAGYDWKVSTPTFNVNPGLYNTDKTVTVTITTSGATIRYTQNGNEPTESDSTVASGGTVSVTTSQTLKAKAFKSGMPASNTTAAAYELKVVTPSTSPAQGTYSSAQSVTMSTSTSGATLRYTTDGVTTPTESSTAYSSAINVATTTTFRVRGFKSGWTASDELTRTYTMNFGTLAAPSADNGTGSYTNSVTVTLSSISGATIRYTTNNTAVQGNSPIYTTPFAFDTTTTLRAKAYHPDYGTNTEAILTYTLSASAPTFNPTAGSYVAGQLVTITSPSVGSTLRYTLNGSEPTTSDPTLTSGGTLVVGNYTLKAKAWKTGANASATTSAAYTISGEVAPPALLASASHTLAIRSDGTAWAWGSGGSGQLGDGTSTSRLLPTIVSGLTGSLALSAGSNFSHVLSTGGTVVGFGGNSDGRLGDGTTTARSLPWSISALSGIVAIEGGEDHALALKGDGTLVAWGTNSEGQIGNGTTGASQVSPTAVNTLTSVAAISAGRDFSLAVKQDGTVWAWGENTMGQLGDDSTTSRTSPVQVDDITTATKVSAGSSHALALLADGTVMAWGFNAAGQLGDGTETDRHTPVEVGLLSDVVAVAAGSAFSMALKDDGTVWTWGANSNGQLGDGTTTERWTAAQVPGLSGIVQITAGDHFALALASDGSVWAWGANGSGQLGNGLTTNALSPVQIAGAGMSWRVATPTLSVASGQYSTNQSVTVAIADPEATLRYTTTGTDPTSSDATVTSGASLTVDVSQTLKVSGWKTGHPTSVVVARTYELKAVTPTLTPGSGAYGSTQSVSIASTTSGATIRYTTDGTEPTSSSTAYSSAVSVSQTQTVKARAYKTGWTASDSGHASYWLSEGTVATPSISPSGGAQTSPPLVAITTATSGATIRYTLDGSTPTGSAPVFLYPFLVHATTTVKAKAFKAGYTASAVATTTYEVDAAGATATPLIVPAGGMYATAQTVTITGASGATLRYTIDGTDPTTSSTSITSGNTVSVAKSQVLKVRAWATGLDPSAVRRADFMVTGAVAAGYLFSAALDSAGGVWTWGSDGYGEQGNGAGAPTTVLSAAQVLSGAAALAAGSQHVAVAKADGTLWTWGDNISGGGHFTSPTQVSGFTNASAVAAGGGFTLILKSDGTVWSYGTNTYGQLGDGTTTNRTAPVAVVGLTGVVAIAAGQDASYAMQTDGAGTGIVWAWGRNHYGQLGDGSTLSRLTPVRVLGITNPMRISASPGGQFALALQANGQIVAWGRNSAGQLGDGTVNDRPSAAAVNVITKVRVMGAGREHALAVDGMARAFGWGNRPSSGMAGAPGDTLVPEPSDLGAALAISGGHEHTLTVRPDGTVAAVGSNGGRLGNGSSAGTNAIVTVSGLELADNDWLMSDADSDHLVTWREYFSGTDPLNPDTNGNGILDGLDDRTGADGLNPDVDGDGVPNWIEQVNGTDPFRADTDGDTVPDGSDVYPLDPTRSMAPSSNPSDTTPPIITLKEPVSAVPVP